MQNKEILILGGGPSGMAAAMELHKGGKKFSVIERQSAVGGMSKTLTFGDFRTDIGPHRFFSKNQYLYSFVEDLLGEKWIPVERLTRFFINNKFFLYPVKITNVLSNVSMWFAFRVLFDYFAEKVRAEISPREINSFEDYVVANFGRTLAEFNMINYTEKIWGIPSSQISKLQGEQRLKSLSLWETLKKALDPRKSDARSLVDVFYYPSEGTGLIYDSISERITEEGNEIFTESTPTKIKYENNRITSVELDISGKTEKVSPEWLVTSIPINQMIAMMKPEVPSEVKDAASKLRWRSQKYLFITLDRESVSKDNWIYFHEESIPFGRLYEPRNMSKTLSPEGKTSLFIEFCVFKGDEIWNMSTDELWELSYPHLEKVFGIKKEELIDKYSYEIEHVYPIYDIDYDKQLKIIKDYLDQFENLVYIGRPGRFLWANQDHALEMGILAARKVIEGREVDIENIGNEREYFEAGYVK